MNAKKKSETTDKKVAQPLGRLEQKTRYKTQRSCTETYESHSKREALLTVFSIIIHKKCLKR
jgi:hypothetical protein